MVGDVGEPYSETLRIQQGLRVLHFSLWVYYNYTCENCKFLPKVTPIHPKKEGGSVGVKCGYNLEQK
jgi:hypothetical protein